MGKKIWTASEATVIFKTTTTTITTAAALDTFFEGGTNVTGVLKNITITEPFGDVDPVQLLGTDTNGFHNAAKERKPPSMVEITGTAILPNSAVIEKIIYGDGITIGTGVKRYRAGKAAPVYFDFLMTLDDGTDKVNYAGIDFEFTAKDVSLGDAESHFEVPFTMKGLPRDWFGPEMSD